MKPISRRPNLRQLSNYVCQSCTQKSVLNQKKSYATATSTTDIYDVVCIGGGPAGLSLLAALRSNPATAKLRIALVETKDLSQDHNFTLPLTEFSNRCSSLTPSSARFLGRIGAWKYVQQERVQPYHEMKVWDGVTGATIDFEWDSEKKGSTIAYMNENLNLTSGLLKRVSELGGVDILDKEFVKGINLGEESEDADLRSWPIVTLSSGRQLAARLLVGADGANSPVRKFAGIKRIEWDYKRWGVVATLQLEHNGWGKEGERIAYQRFMPTGPVAMLPLPGNYASLVWTTTPKIADRLRGINQQDSTPPKQQNIAALVNAAFRLTPAEMDYYYFKATEQGTDLTQDIEWRIMQSSKGVDARKLPPRVVAVQDNSVAKFPLVLRHAETYVGERVALVGDAAHTIHPLAGQGLNQGQGDVECLAKTIEYAVTHGQDIGVRMSLEPYNAERYATNHLMLGVCDKIHNLYSVGSGPIVSLRSVGLKAVNALGPIKRALMEQAAGTRM